jgi:hypothetical protein
MTRPRLPLYYTTPVILLALFFVPPLGICLALRSRWTARSKTIATIAAGTLFLFMCRDMRGGARNVGPRPQPAPMILGATTAVLPPSRGEPAVAKDAASVIRAIPVSSGTRASEADQARKRDALEVADQQRRVKEQLKLYKERLSKADVTHGLIRSLGLEGDPDELVITVAPSWNRASVSARRMTAQALWRIWTQVHSSLDWDKAKIKIVDQVGTDLGGSSSLAGSVISVR